MAKFVTKRTPVSSSHLGNEEMEHKKLRRWFSYFNPLVYSITGVFIADLHIEDAVVPASEIKSVTESCWNDRPNDVFSLNNLRFTSLNGVIIQVPASCDRMYIFVYVIVLQYLPTRSILILI